MNYPIFSDIDSDTKLDIDKTLKTLCISVFDLDRDYYRIISTIAEQGPLTEYALGKKTEKYNLNRDSVRRRIFGGGSLWSLKEKNFIIETTRRKLNFKKEKKYTKKYGLTFKGLLASLNYTKFENNYLVKSSSYMINEVLESYSYVDCYVIQLFKYYVALVLSWLKINGLNIKNQEDTVQYLLNMNSYDSILDPRFSNFYIKDEVLLESFQKLQHRFFVLENVVSFLFQKISASSSIEIKLFNSSIQFGSLKEIRDILILISDWIKYFETSQINVKDIPAITQRKSSTPEERKTQLDQINKDTKKDSKKSKV